MDTSLVLTITAASVAVLHTLIPDHEIPLAMIGRAQNWTIKRMAGVTLIAGIIHISVSMVIGLIALAVSSILAQQLALTAHRISGVFLIAFGLVYSVLALRREHAHGHSHPNSRTQENEQGPDLNLPDNEHRSIGSNVERDSEGKYVISGSAWIVAIVGIAPCFTLIPLLIDAMWFGTTTILWVMFVYAVSTIGSMVVLTSIALKTITFLTRLEKVERHIEVLAGMVILAVGLYVVLPDLLFPAHRHI